MYLYIGGDRVVDRRNIVGVFDIENSTVSGITREYLINMGKKGKVISVKEDMPKSFIVTAGDEGANVYISSLSPMTLKKRFEEDEREFGI
jgi:hypothetical protein